MNRKKLISIIAVSFLLIAFCVGAAAADDTPKMTAAANSSVDSIDIQPISSIEEMAKASETTSFPKKLFEKIIKNITITKTSDGNFLLGGVLGYSKDGEISFENGSAVTPGYFISYKIILPEKYSDINKDATYFSMVDFKGNKGTIPGSWIRPDYNGSDKGVLYINFYNEPSLDIQNMKDNYEITYYKGGVSDPSTATNGKTYTLKLSPDFVTTVSASTPDELIKYAGIFQPILNYSTLLKVNVDKDMKIGYDDFKAFGFPKDSLSIEKAVKVYVTDGATLSLENFSTGDQKKDAERLKELTNAHWQNNMDVENGKIKVSDALGLYTAIYTIKAIGDVITTADITYNGIKIPAGSTIKSKGDSTVTVISPDGKESTMNVALTSTSSPGFGILAVLAGLGAVAIPTFRRIRK